MVRGTIEEKIFHIVKAVRESKSRVGQAGDEGVELTVGDITSLIQQPGPEEPEEEGEEEDGREGSSHTLTVNDGSHSCAGSSNLDNVGSNLGIAGPSHVDFSGTDSNTATSSNMVDSVEDHSSVRPNGRNVDDAGSSNIGTIVGSSNADDGRSSDFGNNRSSSDVDSCSASSNVGSNSVGSSAGSNNDNSGAGLSNVSSSARSNNVGKCAGSTNDNNGAGASDAGSSAGSNNVGKSAGPNHVGCSAGAINVGSTSVLSNGGSSISSNNDEDASNDNDTGKVSSSSGSGNMVKSLGSSDDDSKTRSKIIGCVGRGFEISGSAASSTCGSSNADNTVTPFDVDSQDGPINVGSISGSSAVGSTSGSSDIVCSAQSRYVKDGEDLCSRVSKTCRDDNKVDTANDIKAVVGVTVGAGELDIHCSGKRTRETERSRIKITHTDEATCGKESSGIISTSVGFKNVSLVQHSSERRSDRDGVENNLAGAFCSGDSNECGENATKPVNSNTIEENADRSATEIKSGTLTSTSLLIPNVLQSDLSSNTAKTYSESGPLYGTKENRSTSVPAEANHVEFSGTATVSAASNIPHSGTTAAASSSSAMPLTTVMGGTAFTSSMPSSSGHQS